MPRNDAPTWVSESKELRTRAGLVAPVGHSGPRFGALTANQCAVFPPPPVP